MSSLPTSSVYLLVELPTPVITPNLGGPTQTLKLRPLTPFLVRRRINCPRRSVKLRDFNYVTYSFRHSLLSIFNGVTPEVHTRSDEFHTGSSTTPSTYLYV